MKNLRLSHDKPPVICSHMRTNAIAWIWNHTLKKARTVSGSFGEGTLSRGGML